MNTLKIMKNPKESSKTTRGKKNKLTGTSLAGGGVNYQRVENDFYATDKNSVRDLFQNYGFGIFGVHERLEYTFLEPCVGQGHIADVIKEYCPKSEITGCDIVDRGWKGTRVVDYLQDLLMEDEKFKTQKFDWVITNPPFKHAREFIEKSLSQTDKGVAMFLKIQFLEGQARKEWFKSSPLKYVYVFSKRQDPLRDGMELNPDTGKKWGSTMCFAWFIWEHGYTGEPIVRWI